MEPPDARTSALMRRVRTKRTAAEETVAEALRRLGVRYRRNAKTLPGSPDFSNRSAGWAIFVHGCFWHAHDCRRGARPKHNADFWNAKLDRNRARDATKETALREAGLQVLTVWECELKDGLGLRTRLEGFLGRR